MHCQTLQRECSSLQTAAAAAAAAVGARRSTVVCVANCVSVCLSMFSLHATVFVRVHVCAHFFVCENQLAGGSSSSNELKVRARTGSERGVRKVLSFSDRKSCPHRAINNSTSLSISTLSTGIARQLVEHRLSSCIMMVPQSN